MKNKSFIILTIIFCAFASTRAQVAAGGSYTLDQSVIASGGGQNSAGGVFTIDGTIGQFVAAPNSSGGRFSIAAGFWTAAPFSTTAASVGISGRVLMPDGNGLTNAVVVLTDLRGDTRTVITTSFGYYRFSEVYAGETYVFTVKSKRYLFAPQVAFVSEEIVNFDFVAISARSRIEEN